MYDRGFRHRSLISWIDADDKGVKGGETLDQSFELEAVHSGWGW